ncbi:hypothetical protein RZS08_30460, partial [Arthrospira platensis SPKY1]|nr:hypothetical protein [Arthrospira platensis SPKY1]
MEKPGIGLNMATRWSRRTWLTLLAAGGVWPWLSRAQGFAPPWPPTLTLEYDVSGQARGLPYRASGQLTWRGQTERYE